MGFIDKTGKIVINPQFEFAHNFGKNGLAPVRIGEKMGAINRLGELVINPHYDYIEAYLSDFEFDNVLFVYHDKKWGLIDTQGNYIVEPIFDCVVSIMDGLGAQIWKKLDF